MNTINHKSLIKRDESFDALRGIAIIAVVAIHASGSIFSSGNVSFDNLIFNAFLLYRQSLNFAVPAFLFISGYWISNKKVESLEEYRQFLTQRLKRVVVPYLFWSIMILSIEATITQVFDIQEILFKLLTGRATGPYYFIILIVQFYMLTPILQRINKNPHGFILILFINFISLSFSYITRLYFGSFFSSLSVYAMPFYTWIIFYEFGILYRNFDRYEISKQIATLIAISIVFALIISFFEAKIILIKYDNLAFAISTVKFSSFLYSGCFITGFLYIRQKVSKWSNLIVSLGNYSFGIYLMHIPVLLIVQLFLKETFFKEGIYYFTQPIFQFTCVSTTVIICYVFIFTSKRILPSVIHNTLLGF